MTARYLRFTTCVGRAVLVANARAIMGLALADDDPPLEGFLTEEFPSAQASEDADLRTWAQAICTALELGTGFDAVPVDAPGSPFQQRVWSELRRIPRGQTRTYRQIAASLGQASASRAVARACATNPASLVIPCHRVIRTDGALAGYRWGLTRKRLLLDLEKVDLR